MSSRLQHQYDASPSEVIQSSSDIEPHTPGKFPSQPLRPHPALPAYLQYPPWPIPAPPMKPHQPATTSAWACGLIDVGRPDTATASLRYAALLHC
ncbi:hypothetical protein EJ06DRAFT_526103 [Trichodelitschia bisporula]|uniref:Uncharacterized protein n=1 Tax=Trichodelitschia bisporula TaxID=703511 RepID=A0A6G1IBB3_9PEZI|nr:hypothetical protein EJ06DRAFT_526103 [Trichodelitschia bisporula]